MMKHTNRIYAGLLAALCCTGMTGVSGTAFAVDEPAYDIQFGDVNNDNSIDVTDAQTVLQAYTDALAGVADTMEDWQKGAADVDKNGKVDVSDAQYILNYYVANTVAGKPTAWEEIIKPASDTTEPEHSGANYENAFAALEKSMQALRDKDYRTVLDVTNYRSASLIFSDDVKTDEEIISEEMDPQNVLSFEIGEGTEDTETPAIFNESAAELKAEGEQRLKEEREAAEVNEKHIRLIEAFMPELEPIEKIYRFRVTGKIQGAPKEVNGEVQEQEVNDFDEVFIVYLRGGRWTVDVGLIELLAYEPRDTKVRSCDSAARSIRNAYTAALVKMETSYDTDISVFNGDHFYKGGDFAAILEAGLPDQSAGAEAMLKYFVAYNYKAIGNIADFAVTVENGSVKAAAVSIEYQGKLWYGTYPAPQHENHDVPVYDDINAALTVAKKLAEENEA